jgi:nucleotide-binding universal stress UspA family protein
VIDGEVTSSVEQMQNIAVELGNALSQCEVLSIVRKGDPKTVILDLAEQMRADLIIVGSNCKSTLERLLLGSVSQSILNAAKCPVLLAKTPCSLAQDASPGFRNVLVPVDNSVYSDVAVHWLVNFHWAPETRIIVAAVVGEDTDREDVRQSLERRAWDVSRLLNTNNVTVEIVKGEPKEAIVNLSRQHYADLILIGSHGHSGFKQMILGSVSQAVSQAAPCAVAIIRGLAAADKSWKRTGVFKKVEFVNPGSGVRIEKERKDMSVHIMPGGF